MNTQSGSSFIEILISMSILSIVLLGMDAMIIHAIRETKSAYYFAVATQQIDNFIERLHTFDHSEWEAQLACWNKENMLVLPQGHGELSDNSIMIFWGKNTQQECKKNRIGQSGCVHITIKK